MLINRACELKGQFNMTVNGVCTGRWCELSGRCELVRTKSSGIHCSWINATPKSKTKQCNTYFLWLIILQCTIRYVVLFCNCRSTFYIFLSFSCNMWNLNHFSYWQINYKSNYNNLLTTKTWKFHLYKHKWCHDKYIWHSMNQSLFMNSSVTSNKSLCNRLHVWYDSLFF